MSIKPTLAVRNFVDHVSAQEKARAENIENALLTEAFKAEREDLAQAVLTVLGLTASQLQTKLAIGRATWDRWRSAGTIPQRSHVEALLRFASEKEFFEAREASAELPPPLDMLTASPYSWGQIKLVYSVYPWRNAVFKFRAAFIEEQTAFEMLLLAFRGCRIVYIMPGAENWCPRFVKIAIDAVGESRAASALTRICIVSVPPEQAELGVEYGLFNYGVEDEKESAGYVWQRDGLDEPPPLSEPNVYRSANARDDNVYGELRKVYSKYLDLAFDQILAREKLNFWTQDEVDEKLLKIPVICFKSANATFCG